jgi:hypothetical protein
MHKVKKAATVIPMNSELMIQLEVWSFKSDLSEICDYSLTIEMVSSAACLVRLKADTPMVSFDLTPLVPLSIKWSGGDGEERF